MKRIAFSTNRALMIMIAGMLVVSPAIADKPSWAGGGKGDSEKDGQRDEPDNSKGGQRGGDARSSRDNAPAVRASNRFGDILLLAIGTGMVIDAIQNLGR